MKIMIFNGSLENGPHATSHKVIVPLKKKLEAAGISPVVFNLADADIPLLDFSHKETPVSVKNMVTTFRECDAHIWLTPMYHGSMTGAMKNCLDWLEISAKEPIPYLTNKVVGMICWADGVQAMQGINAMDSVAKALRAWVMPYSIPMVRGEISVSKDDDTLTEDYSKKLDIMVDLIAAGSPVSKIPGV
ncbi:NADPH-dependent FMN reductase [Marinoscillum sp. MHG1-6]|uniref:NADPH-dependent FMN reductase n=1 Tax=Marinoscillum sp. MHG1-6 TaxID=2959627 RepID=UPI0021587DE7|nr:NADPH-dependent FMN reductase [Marinoscillum sp. MHG1-6]